MLPSNLSALTLSPPLSGHISVASLVPETVASPGTKSECQRDVKLYILGAENVLLSFNCKDIILSERSTEGGGCTTVVVFTNPLFNPYVILSMNIAW